MRKRPLTGLIGHTWSPRLAHLGLEANSNRLLRHYIRHHQPGWFTRDSPRNYSQLKVVRDRDVRFRPCYSPYASNHSQHKFGVTLISLGYRSIRRSTKWLCTRMILF
ncbi:hypothetical protein FKM82_025744 [Ascaphus truei]